MALGAALGLGACRGGSSATAPGPTDPTYVASIDSWHADRVESLKKPLGWLSLVGLSWLDEERSYTLGGADSDIPVPRAAGPLGTLKRVGPLVILDASPGSGVQVDGVEAIGSVELRTDGHDRGASKVSVGDVQFHVIDRAGRLGVRMKDPQAATRESFRGVPRFEVDATYRVTATLEPAEPSARIGIPTVLGTTLDEPTPGTLRFELGGTSHALTPIGSKEDGLFLAFGDMSNGLPAGQGGTYGGGRFLSVPWNGEPTVELDFNKAINPPCAFTPHATCPLPPRENKLAIALPAGEKVPPGPSPAH